MSIDKAKDLIEKIARTVVEDERKANDELLSQKAKNAVDTLTAEKLTRIEQGIESFQTELDGLKNAMNRVSVSESTLEENKNAAYREVFNKMLRAKGLKQTINLTEAENKIWQAMSAGDKANNAGGYLVPEGQATSIAEQVLAQTPILQLIVGGTSTLDSVPYLVQVTNAAVTSLGATGDGTGTGAIGYRQEHVATSDTTTPTIEEIRHQMFTVEAEPWLTRELLEDASFDVAGFLAREIVRTYSYYYGDQSINGDGTTEIKGILNYVDTSSTYAIVKKITATNGDAATGIRFDFDDVIDALYDIDSRYVPNEGALTIGANRKVVAHMRKLRTTDGVYLWTPDVTGAGNNTFNGVRVVEFPTMPTVSGTGSEVALVVGNFRDGYNIVKHAKGSTTIEDIYTAKKYIKYYSKERAAGGCVDARALRVLFTKAS